MKNNTIKNKFQKQNNKTQKRNLERKNLDIKKYKNDTIILFSPNKKAIEIAKGAVIGFIIVMLSYSITLFVGTRL